MSDLDSLLQDFSYLRSLEYRDQAPKHSKKLKLPHPSVHYAVEQVFKATEECTFERLYHRPIGYRCLLDFFASDDYRKHNLAGTLCMEFVDIVKTSTTDTTSASLLKCNELIRDYLENQALSDILNKESTRSKIDKAIEKVREASKGQEKMVRIADVLRPAVKAARRYLATSPWDDFLQSPMFVRYCRWKHLELNMKIDEEDFDVHRILGKGGFGEVFPCRKRDTGAVFAMKKLDKRRLKLKQQEHTAIHERDMLMEMTGKFVTGLKYAFQDSQSLFLIQDLMEGGDLHFHLKRLNKFDTWQTKFYTAQITLGLRHIHSLGIVYRDLKPPNVLLDADGNARISDLGLARRIKTSFPSARCGTQGYMAPEVIKPDVHYGESCDWWSLGCTCYQFLTGYLPHRPHHEKISKDELQARVLDPEYKIRYSKSLPTEAIEFIRGLLLHDPEKRLGCGPDKSADVMNHPFFQDLDWVALEDHKIQAPITPFRGQVNAKDVFDIERFDEHEVRKVKITAEDNDRYKHFNYMMSHQWQEEVLKSAYTFISRQADKEDQKRAHRRSKMNLDEGQPDEIIVMQGFMLKLSNGLFSRGSLRYFELSESHLKWRKDDFSPVKGIIQLSTISELTITAGSDSTPAKFTISCPERTKDLELECQFVSDSPVWEDMLMFYYKKAKGEPVERRPTFSKSTSRHLEAIAVVSADLADSTNDPLQVEDDS